MLRFTRSDWRIAATATILATLLIIACMLALGAQLAKADGLAPHAPALSEASASPAYSRVIAPGRSVSKARQCGRTGTFTEYSAYRVDGSAIGRQHWTDGPFPYAWWRLPRVGGYVSYDGVTFTNHAPVSVLVAAWCS